MGKRLNESSTSPVARRARVTMRIVLAGVLVVLLVVIVGRAVARGDLHWGAAAEQSAEPSASAPASSTPPSTSPSGPPRALPAVSEPPALTPEVPVPAPEPTTPNVVSFTNLHQVVCPQPGQPSNGADEVILSWQTERVQEAWIGVATYDAIIAPYDSVQASQGQISLYFPCPSASQIYTLSVVGTDGSVVHSTIEVTNAGYVQ